MMENNHNNFISLEKTLSKIDDLALQHNQAEEAWLYEDLELKAIKVIADYCRNNNLAEVAGKIDELFIKADEDLEAYEELFSLIENTENTFTVDDSYKQLRDYFIQKFWPKL